MAEPGPLQEKEVLFAVVDKEADIDYITVTTSASCLVCMGEDGYLLGNAIMVSDRRAVEEAEWIKKSASYSREKNDTGLEVSASLMLPKILWVKNHKPEIPLFLKQ